MSSHENGPAALLLHTVQWVQNYSNPPAADANRGRRALWPALALVRLLLYSWFIILRVGHYPGAGIALMVRLLSRRASVDLPGVVDGDAERQTWRAAIERAVNLVQPTALTRRPAPPPLAALDDIGTSLEHTFVVDAMTDNTFVGAPLQLPLLFSECQSCLRRGEPGRKLLPQSGRAHSIVVYRSNGPVIGTVQTFYCTTCRATHQYDHFRVGHTWVRNLDISIAPSTAYVFVSELTAASKEFVASVELHLVHAQTPFATQVWYMSPTCFFFKLAVFLLMSPHALTLFTLLLFFVG